MSRAGRYTLVFGVLLAASLLLNAALLWGLWDSFGKLQLVRIFPLGFVPLAQQPAARASMGPTLTFWGDSRAYLWDESGLDGLTILTQAHGGQTSSQLMLQLASEQPSRTRYALVQTGINDLHPLGALHAQKTTIVRTLEANLRALPHRLLERSDIVILTTIFPPSPVPLVRRPTWDAETLQLIDAANRTIRSLADGERVIVLDTHGLLRDEQGYLKAEFADPDFFLHVNAQGYAVLNTALLRLLSPEGEGPAVR